MQAIRFSRHGGPEVLERVDLPDPAPGPGELLLDLASTAVNYADLLMVRGLYPTVKAPGVPGLEAAGTVLSVGPGVTRFVPGNRVMALVRGGTYATRVVALERAAVAVPGSFDWAEAGAFMETFYTAWHALFSVGHAVAGETVLVMAAAGGVGTSALQLARERGLKTIAAAGSPEKLASVKDLATAGTVDYRREDLAARVRELTDGRGVDVVLESVGGELAQAAFETLAPLGRIVVFGSASGQWAEFPTHKLLGRAVSVCGMSLTKLLASSPDAIDRATDGLMGLVARGRIRPVIGHRMSLWDAAKAHELMASRGSTGKIVLTREAA